MVSPLDCCHPSSSAASGRADLRIRAGFSARRTSGSPTEPSRTVRSPQAARAKAGWDLIGGSVTISGTRAWGSTDTDKVDVVIGQTSGVTIPSSGADYVNHAYDRIWFVVRPLINLTYTAATATRPATVEWAFAAPQPTTSYMYWVYTGWLTDPSTMPQSVRDFLDSAGISRSYYSELLKADPFAYGITPGQYIDSARFELVRTLPYIPRASPTLPPLTQEYTLTRSTTNSSTTMREVSYSASVTATTGLVFSQASASYGFGWKSSTSSTTSTTSDAGESITIGQPSFGYNGPTVIRVYVDKIWKTYFVAQDYQ